MYAKYLLLAAIPAVFAAPAPADAPAAAQITEPAVLRARAALEARIEARAGGKAKSLAKVGGSKPKTQTVTATATATAAQDCDTLTDDTAYMNCWLTQDGWNSAAAQYIATAMNAGKGEVGDAWEGMWTIPGYSSEATAFYNQPAISTKSNQVTELVTFELAKATYITQPTLRAAVTSILNNGLAMQNDPKNQPKTTSSKAGAGSPMQTGIGMQVAAGVAAGIVGVAFGL